MCDFAPVMLNNSLNGGLLQGKASKSQTPDHVNAHIYSHDSL